MDLFFFSVGSCVLQIKTIITYFSFLFFQLSPINTVCFFQAAHIMHRNDDFYVAKKLHQIAQ